MKMMKLRSLVLAGFLALPVASSFAQVDISVNVAPPVLPVYEQPLCPTEGYIWTPGYWGWGDGDYYWVPGVWVPPPRVGLLWTPAWWGWNNGAYVFNQGYWGPHVGFYGGINYGYGYTGNGYWGGRWNGNALRYNTAVTRVNTNVVHNTYVNNSFNKQVNANRTSFNGPQWDKGTADRGTKSRCGECQESGANVRAACASAGGEQGPKSPGVGEQGQSERRCDQLIQQGRRRWARQGRAGTRGRRGSSRSSRRRKQGGELIRA